MKSRFLFQKFAASALIFASISAVLGQHPQTPKQEKLLNGLKLLMWNDPTADKVTIKVRIHSGTAFDPQGKEGLMALLAESFFPNETARDFFKEDLGGGLTINAGYDYIQVGASARATDFLTMLESVATAVSNPTIDKETTVKVKATQSAKVAELEKDASYVADRAVAKRLFGTFPYGRSELGTTESIKTIEFPDLLDAKKRFITADNATVTISGKIDEVLTYRAARRYFGSWLKSDKLSPSTFKQPDEPDTKMVSLTGEYNGDSQVRFALRGVARNEKDYAASVVLAAILSERLKQNLSTGTGFVSNQAHILPGAVVLGFKGSVGESTPVNLATLLLAKAVTNEEFAAARSKAASAFRDTPTDEQWLNADTYKLVSVAEDVKAFEAVMLADVQHLAERLSRNPVIAISIVKLSSPATAN